MKLKIYLKHILYFIFNIINLLRGGSRNFYIQIVSLKRTLQWFFSPTCATQSHLDFLWVTAFLKFLYNSVVFVLCTNSKTGKNAKNLVTLNVIGVVIIMSYEVGLNSTSLVVFGSFRMAKSTRVSSQPIVFTSLLKVMRSWLKDFGITWLVAT